MHDISPVPAVNLCKVPLYPNVLPSGPRLNIGSLLSKLYPYVIATINDITNHHCDVIIFILLKFMLTYIISTYIFVQPSPPRRWPAEKKSFNNGKAGTHISRKGGYLGADSR